MVDAARGRQRTPALCKAMILAAGKGTRLRELTVDRPKPMLPVGGRPLLEQLLVLLRDQGISEFAINLHYLGAVIRDYFGNGARWGVRIHYLEEETLLGSAGTLLHLRHYFDEAFLVASGDLYTDADVRSLLAFHRQRPALLTIALHEAEEPTREGIVATEPCTGRVTRFVEKPAIGEIFTRQANAGLYVIEPAALDVISSADPPLDIGGDLIPALLRRDLPVFATPLDGFVLDIGAPERYREAVRRAARAQEVAVHDHL